MPVTTKRFNNPLGGEAGVGEVNASDRSK